MSLLVCQTDSCSRWMDYRAGVLAKGQSQAQWVPSRRMAYVCFAVHHLLLILPLQQCRRQVVPEATLRKQSGVLEMEGLRWPRPLVIVTHFAGRGNYFTSIYTDLSFFYWGWEYWHFYFSSIYYLCFLVP